MSLNSRHVGNLRVSDSGDEGTGSSRHSTVPRPKSALVTGQLQEAESSSKLPPKLLAWLLSNQIASQYLLEGSRHRNYCVLSPRFPRHGDYNGVSIWQAI
ncbi:unnamed protein product [Brassica rapa]|uniref:Uncharacterized protein n=1 Tax=Brassica campestris TaxID=3711 RepID=A0A8D9GWU3_BRACM|nr:unnamed protein product [Brassica rapa]